MTAHPTSSSSWDRILSELGLFIHLCARYGSVILIANKHQRLERNVEINLFFYRDNGVSGFGLITIFHFVYE